MILKKFLKKFMDKLDKKLEKKAKECECNTCDCEKEK